MIITEIYNGQGLGNQLWCYVVTRVIAKDKGYDFGIMHPEKFKCLDFIDLNFGEKVTGGNGPEGGPPDTLPDGIKYYYREKEILHLKTEADIRTYDKNLVNIEDDTKIDGYMQDENYIIHRKNEIRNWLKVKDGFENLKYSKEDICIINFRGGEYVSHRDIFLPQKYWDNAIKNIKKINPKMEFIVVTDDVLAARKFFPKFEISHDSIGSDYSIINNAYYLILSNSSFAFFPAWLNEKVKKVIAPKYWARHNISNGYWCLGYNIVKDWHYIDRSGEVFNYDQCIEEINNYKLNKYKDLSPKNKTNVWFLAYRVKRKFKIILKDFNKKIYYFKGPILNKINFILYKNLSLLKTKFTNINSNKNSNGSIKIYDIFTYNGEKEILDIRLNILYDHVDQFIIVEAPTTFSGLKKPLYFKEQEVYFTKFADKIKYFIINDYPNDIDILKLADESSNVPKDGPEHWKREFYQKESIKKALVNLKDNDICFIGDVDEIWNPKTKIAYRKNDIYKLEQMVYSYYLNNRSNEKWYGTLATKYINIKNNCLNHLRTQNKTIYTYVKNGGWHFTSMGGIEEVRRKLNDSYTDETYNTTTARKILEDKFGENDYLNKKLK